MIKNIDMLCVNMDQNDAQLVEAIFTKENFHAVFKFIDNSADALQELHKWQQQSATQKIIFIDINKVQLGGIELLKEIRSNPKLKSVLIFVFTEIKDDESRELARSLNIAAYISKPSAMEERRQVFEILYDYLSIIELSTETV